MKWLYDDILFVEADKKGRYPFSHSLYVKGEKNTLIDTGAGSVMHDFQNDTEQVVLSHYHRDHVAYNNLFTKSKLMIHEADMDGLVSFEGFKKLSGLGDTNIEEYWKIVKQKKFEASRVNHCFTDGELIDIGNNEFTVLHLPGHSPGHCGFYFEKYNLVFSADIDLTTFGPWYGNVSSDIFSFRESIKRLCVLKPDMIVTSHSSPVSENIIKKLEQYDQIFDIRDDAIIKILKKAPSTLDDLVAHQIIYGNHHGLEILEYFERNMIKKHLDLLLSRDSVEYYNERYYLK